MEFMLLFADRKGAPAGDPAGMAELKGFGMAFVTDGPFAESKEIVAGFWILEVASRDEAIEIAKRYPHARWGPVEVRELLFLDAA